MLECICVSAECSNVMLVYCASACVLVTELFRLLINDVDKNRYSQTCGQSSGEWKKAQIAIVTGYYMCNYRVWKKK